MHKQVRLGRTYTDNLAGKETLAYCIFIGAFIQITFVFIEQKFLQ